MMRFLLPAVLAIAVLLGAVSCIEGNGDGGRVVISLRNTSLPCESGSTWASVESEGSWSITLSYAGGEGWASVDPSQGSGSKGDVRFRYDANDDTASRSVTLTIRSGSLYSSVTAVQEGVSDSPGPGPGNSGPFGRDVAPFGWLELPAMQAGDGLTFYSRDMDGRRYVSSSSNSMRNWSNYWDASEHLSLWVAYPLNRKLIGNGSRSNAWGLDPQIPADEQPNFTGGSYGGGWTRGHQIPSADRLTYVPNVTTFYGTNMTPQEYYFNGEIWASLEGKVRAYASLADTLYVVTGCLYEDSDTYTGYSSGFSIKVPTHYFKALLFRGVSTYASAEGFMAAGFLLPHNPDIRKDDCLNYIMSIDELESQTGIDFFPNLADVVGSDKAAAVEALTPSKWWK